MFDKLSELFSSDSNSERYRKRMSSLKPPAIPFLGELPSYGPARRCHGAAGARAHTDASPLWQWRGAFLPGLHLSDLTFLSEAGKGTADRQEREAQVRFFARRGVASKRSPPAYAASAVSTLPHLGALGHR